MSPVPSTSIADELRSTAGATFDFVVAAACLAVVVGLPLAVGNDALGHPLAPNHAQWVVAVVALGGSYPFVADPRLLDRLTSFVLWLVAALLTFPVVVSIPFFAVGGVPTDSAIARTTQVALVAAAYAFAAFEWDASSPARD